MTHVSPTPEAADLLRAEHAVARILASSPSRREMAGALLEAVGLALGWAVGAVWMPDEDGDGRLRCIATWSAPWFDGAAFCARTSGLRLKPGEGLPGRVVAEGRPAWLADLPPELPRARAAARAGLRSALSFPLMGAERALGAVEYFSAERHEPDSDLLATIGSLGGQVGQYLERRRAEDAMRTADARRRAVLEAALDSVVTMDAEGLIVDANPATERTFGRSADELVGRELAEVLVPGHLREAHRRGLAHYLATGETALIGRRYETTALRADGSEFPVEVAIHRLDVPGAPVFTGYIRDLTHHVEAQARLQVLAEEQAALRRLATLVATGARRERVFSAVTEEVGRLLGAETSNMVRFVGDGTADVVGAWHAEGAFSVPVGDRVPLDGDTVASRIARTGRPERVDSYAGLGGRLAESLRQLGFQAAVGTPVVVEGELWGAVIVSTVEPEPFPPGAEDRIAGFAELVAQALANAEAREQLAASRARLVAASDAERRRLERNLHDGAQQRLVALSLRLGIAERQLAGDPEGARATLREAGDELSRALEELRELARGLHPAVLTEHGLAAALAALTARAPTPVEILVDVGGRLPPPVEAASYYVVAESLANAGKHAAASAVRVAVTRAAGGVRVEVSDDGVGGADARRGSGLRGLADRGEALGGRLRVQSPHGGGTTVRADLPLQ